MRKFTKIFAVLMAAVVAMTAMCVVSSAKYDSREIFSGAKAAVGSIKSGPSYSTVLKEHHDEVMYKFSCSGSGTLKVEFTAHMKTVHIYVYDGNGKNVDYGTVKVTSGIDYINKWHSIDWDSKKTYSSGSLSFKVSKGTYYIRFIRDYEYGDGSLKFKATFPSDDTDTTTDTMQIIYLAEGDSLSIGMLSNGKKATSAKYTSSDKSVATVSSKGKIKAKSAGTAIITTKSGSNTVKIQVVVEADD